MRASGRTVIPQGPTAWPERTNLGDRRQANAETGVTTMTHLSDTDDFPTTYADSLCPVADR
jgi:hypothetical protein